jgi:hypothetical protein
VDIGHNEHSAFLCNILDAAEPNAYKAEKLTYFRQREAAAPNPSAPFFERMQIVHRRHIKWLSVQSTVDRDSFLMLANSYARDGTLVGLNFRMMDTLLSDLYAKSQWKAYKCTGDPPTEWHLSSSIASSRLHERMQDVYQKHLEWIQALPCMDYLAHKTWSKTYASDPFMDYDWKVHIKFAADKCFEKYIASIEGALFEDCFHIAAAKYSSKIPCVLDFAKQSNLLALPYYMW